MINSIQHLRRWLATLTPSIAALFFIIDPGRIVAETRYAISWQAAQIEWEVLRMLMYGAVVINGLRQWVVDNTMIIMQFMINGLGPIVFVLLLLAMMIFGLQLTGSRLLKSLPQWVSGEKLLMMAILSALFLGSPEIVVNALEDIRGAVMTVRAGNVISDAGLTLNLGAGGTPEDPLPSAIPDVMSIGPFNGVVDTLDLAAYYLQVDNLDVLDSGDFPPDFEATWFPEGEPANVTLTSEAEREEALRLAFRGNVRMLFAFVAMGTVGAEQALYFSLQMAAIVLYLGLPIALGLSFFVFTQSLFSQYVRQYINLLLETLWSMIIAGAAMWLLITAGGFGFIAYVCATLIAQVLLWWRVISAWMQIAAAFKLADVSQTAGGASVGKAASVAKKAASVGAGVATGGATLAFAGALGTTAAGASLNATRVSRKFGANSSRATAAKNKSRQLQAMTGYALGKNNAVGSIIENTHEARTFAQAFRGNTSDEPGALDYVRAGQMQSRNRTNPWLSIGMSPGLNKAVSNLKDGELATVSSRANSKRKKASKRTRHTGDAPPSEGESDATMQQPTVSFEIPEYEDQASVSATEASQSNQSAAQDEHRKSLAKATQPLLETVKALGSDNAEVKQQAVTALTAQHGTERAGQLQAMTETHGEAAVNKSVDGLNEWVATQRAEGATNREILTQIQRGRNWSPVDDQLTRSERATVAEAVLQPQRTVPGSELVAAAMGARAAGYESEAVAAWLGTEQLPAKATVQMREVQQAADSMGMTKQDVQRAYADMQAQGSETVAEELINNGYSDNQAELLVRSLESVPTSVDVKPSLRFMATDVAGFNQATQQAIQPRSVGKTVVNNAPERAAVLSQVTQGLDANNPAARAMAEQTADRLLSPEQRQRYDAIVNDAGVAPTQEALAYVGDVAKRYENNGRNSAAIARAFAERDGMGIQAIKRGLIDSPLSDSQLHQLSDMAIQPEVMIERSQIATAITQSAWRADGGEQTLTERLQVENFGQYTASVREAAATIAASGIEATTVEQVAGAVEKGDKMTALDLMKRNGISSKHSLAILAAIEQLPAQMRLRRRFVTPQAEEDQDDLAATP